MKLWKLGSSLTDFGGFIRYPALHVYDLEIRLQLKARHPRWRRHTNFLTSNSRGFIHMVRDVLNHLA
jgi:hypothetical protein